MTQTKPADSSTKPRYNDFNLLLTLPKIQLPISNTFNDATRHEKRSKDGKKETCGKHIHGLPIKQQANRKLRVNQELQQQNKKTIYQHCCNKVEIMQLRSKSSKKGHQLMKIFCENFLFLEI